MSSFYTNVERFGDLILHRGYHNGKAFANKIRFKPTLYTKSSKNSTHKSLEGDTLSPITFDSISDAQDFISRYKDVDNFSYYGMENWQFSFLADEYPNETIDYDPTLIRVGIIDIEVRSNEGFPEPEKALWEIVSIALHYNDKYYLFGCKEYKAHLKNAVYIKCVDEKDLLNKFLNLWETIRFDIITGWNVEGFDIPYLVNRINIVLGTEHSKRLSPWGIIRKKEVPTLRGNINKTFTLYGISVLDYYLLYRKFSNSPQESYKLGYIGHVELGMPKIDYEDYGSLDQLYLNDFQRFMEYNTRDDEIIVALEEKIKLLKLAMNLTYWAKSNFIDIFKQTRTWDSYIYSFLRSEGVIIPQRRISEEAEEQIPGGHVMDPVPGMYEWLASVDFTSQYPRLYMQYNISPETYYGKVEVDLDKLAAGEPHGYEEMLKEKNLSLTANGTLYRKDIHGFAPRILEKLFDERASLKRMMLDAMEKLQHIEKEDPLYKEVYGEAASFKIFQETKKVGLNSFYGGSANEGFRFFNQDLASAITTSGQHAIRWGERYLDAYLSKLFGPGKYVVYADTDSCYIRLDRLVEKSGLKDQEKIIQFLTKFVKEKIQPFLSQAFQELAEYMNAFAPRIEMKLEKISSKGIWTAKKRYILNVVSDEYGPLTKPKISVTGIEAVRSSTPEVCRKALETAFWTIINEGEKKTQEFIAKFKKEFFEMPFDMVAKPTGVSDIDKFALKGGNYKSGTPIHVRAAILYNQALIDRNLQNKYATIKNGDKIRFAYLKQPNPIGENVVACIDKIPEEFKLEDHVDYKLQFEKVFLSPLETILGTMDWEIEKTTTLMDF